MSPPPSQFSVILLYSYLAHTCPALEKTFQLQLLPLFVAASIRNSRMTARVSTKSNGFHLTKVFDSNAISGIIHIIERILNTNSIRQSCVMQDAFFVVVVVGN